MTFDCYYDSVPEKDAITIKIDGINIQRVNNVKYLGATFDYNLKWDSHIKNILKYINKLKNSDYLQENIFHRQKKHLEAKIRIVNLPRLVNLKQKQLSKIKDFTQKHKIG